MPRPRGKQVASDIRGAFMRAVRQLEGEGKPLSELMKRSLEADFLGTLRAIQGFVPKELEATVEHKRGADEFTDAELAAIAAGSSAGIAGEAEGSEPLH